MRAESPSWFERRVLRVQEPPMGTVWCVTVLVSLVLVVGTFVYRVSHGFSLLDGVLVVAMLVAYPQMLLRSINDLRRQRA